MLVAAGAAWHFRPGGAVTAATGAPVTGGGRGRGGGAAAIPVVAAVATRGDVPVYLRGLGTVTPSSTVTVRSRIDGQVLSLRFDEGQMVHQGDLLVEIDPRPYQAALAQAQGQLAKDTAAYNDDELDYERYQRLVASKLVPQQQLDSQAALVNEYKGAMASDQAAIDAATLNLAYTRIAAPISGRIGLRLVDSGNIVHASDPNGIAVITQVQPIAVLFNLPQADLPQVYGELHAGGHPEVDAFDATNTALLSHGALLTIDNAIDPTTGTFRCKALFDNVDNALFPNQFVNARLRVGTDAGVTIVPPAAVQRGPEGTYVFVVSPDRKASVRTVRVQITEGAEAGLASGLAPGERVVIDGADKLQDGTPVRLEAPSDAPPAAADAAPGAAPAAAARGAGRGRRAGRGSGSPADAAAARGGR